MLLKFARAQKFTRSAVDARVKENIKVKLKREEKVAIRAREKFSFSPINDFIEFLSSSFTSAKNSIACVGELYFCLLSLTVFSSLFQSISGC